MYSLFTLACVAYCPCNTIIIYDDLSLLQISPSILFLYLKISRDLGSFGVILENRIGCTETGIGVVISFHFFLYFLTSKWPVCCGHVIAQIYLFVNTELMRCIFFTWISCKYLIVLRVYVCMADRSSTYLYVSFSYRVLCCRYFHDICCHIFRCNRFLQCCTVVTSKETFPCKITCSSSLLRSSIHLLFNLIIAF